MTIFIIILVADQTGIHIFLCSHVFCITVDDKSSSYAHFFPMPFVVYLLLFLFFYFFEGLKALLRLVAKVLRLSRMKEE